MKFTETHLKQIIKEELSSILKEREQSKTVDKIPDRAVLAVEGTAYEVWQVNDAYVKNLPDGPIFRMKWSELQSK